MGDDAHDWEKAERYESQFRPRQHGKTARLKELALDPEKTWMEKHAPEILEEEERLELREILLQQQQEEEE